MLEVTERAAGESGREYAHRTLEANIVSLNLAPGEVIHLNDVAAQMGLSRTPVREALLDLAKVGIVEVYPQSGSVVALVDFDLVEEARFLRSTLECAVVAEACAEAKPELLARLHESLRAQEYCLESGQAGTRLLELDNEFHRMLFAAVGKERCFEIVRGFSVHFDRVRSMELTSVRDLKVVSDHRAVLAALEAHDADAARACMAEHLARYKVEAAAMPAHYPDYFKQK